MKHIRRPIALLLTALLLLSAFPCARGEEECDSCGEMITRVRDAEGNTVCPKCGYIFIHAPQTTFFDPSDQPGATDPPADPTDPPAEPTDPPEETAPPTPTPTPVPTATPTPEPASVPEQPTDPPFIPPDPTDIPESTPAPTDPPQITPESPVSLPDPTAAPPAARETDIPVITAAPSPEQTLPPGITLPPEAPPATPTLPPTIPPETLLPAEESPETPAPTPEPAGNKTTATGTYSVVPTRDPYPIFDPDHPERLISVQADPDAWAPVAGEVFWPVPEQGGTPLQQMLGQP